MRIRVIAVGSRMPRWVDEAFQDYIKRLGSTLKPTLLEIAPGARTGGQGGSRAMDAEAQRLLAAVRPDEYVVALDEHGKQLSTHELAEWLNARLLDGRDVALLIGGPDGLAPQVLERSDFKLALSRLTFPHALVRVILAEQLYRAHSILAGHPYHRD
jgi:23S rRNA (pseudouridine1915-N3)-methyltransferase